MSWSRARYDDPTYKHRLAETIGPCDYMVNTPRNCDSCIYYGPGVNLDRKSAALCDKALIDVDSELMGISRKYSQCPANKYLPSSEPFCKANKKEYKECDDLIPEPTLISNPKCTNKETTVNRFEWLCQSPQDNALIPFDYLIDSKLVTKDAHHALIERPIDQSSALPPPCNDKIRYDWASRYTQGPMQYPSVQLATCSKIPQL